MAVSALRGFDAIAETKTLSLGADGYSAGLTFKRSALTRDQVAQLENLVNVPVTLVAERIGVFGVKMEMMKGDGDAQVLVLDEFHPHAVGKFRHILICYPDAG